MNPKYLALAAICLFNHLLHMRQFNLLRPPSQARSCNFFLDLISMELATSWHKIHFFPCCQLGRANTLHFQSSVCFCVFLSPCLKIKNQDLSLVSLTKPHIPQWCYMAATKDGILPAMFVFFYWNMHKITLSFHFLQFQREIWKNEMLNIKRFFPCEIF